MPHYFFLFYFSVPTGRDSFSRPNLALDMSFYLLVHKVEMYENVSASVYVLYKNW